MQTAKIVYLVIWVLIMVPLVAFNIKRISVKKTGEKRRIKWGFTAFITVFAVLISVLLISAYQATLSTRYEIAAERYIDLHAECVTGQISYDDFKVKSAPLLTDNADISALTDELSKTAGTKSAVRFQIGDWITPKYYKGYTSFPQIDVIDDSNPVFLIYRFDDASSQKYYLIEMVWSDSEGWQVAYHAPATDEQVDAARTSLPSKVNGQWFYISG